MQNKSPFADPGKNRNFTKSRPTGKKPCSRVQKRENNASQRVSKSEDLPMINLGYKTHWTNKVEEAVKKAVLSLKKNQRLRIVFSLEIPKPTRKEIKAILRGDFNVTIVFGNTMFPTPSFGITARIEQWAASNGVWLELVDSSTLGSYVELVYERKPSRSARRVGILGSLTK